MSAAADRILGVEGGGTKTEWVYLSREGEGTRRLDSGTLGPANFRHTPRESLLALLRRLPADANHVGVFLAGCADSRDQATLREIVAGVWPRAEIAVGSDRESGFAAAFGEEDGILVIAGTGSAVHGRRSDRIEKAGGWGQLLGDRGSAFDIGLLGLRHCLRTFDVEQRTLPLATAFLRDLGLNSLPELVSWAQQADKLSVANLAPAVFEAARDSESDIGIILDVCARRLAEYAWAVARRLELEEPRVRLMGGVFRHNPEYVRLFGEKLTKRLPEAGIEVCSESGATGAAWLAARRRLAARTAAAPSAETAGFAAAATEQANPRSDDLDSLDPLALVDLFIGEEESVKLALAACRAPLAAAVEVSRKALSGGGRLFYVGAGTSGRLGVLDASEMPPTFGVEPDLVQGIIAGGPEALHRSVEGAEDSALAGRLAVQDRGVRGADVVCGITASGATPFVLGALGRARELGARTILLTCNPNRSSSGDSWDVEIDLPTGPELIAGSTRLKAGTATKVALNIISTGTMIGLGRVRGNLMVDLRPSSAKLRDRAARIVASLRDCSYEEAWQKLAAHDWNVRACLSDSGSITRSSD